MDEQNHIARGLAFLRTGDPRLSLEHPPLINVISAVPLITMPELRLPTDQPSWERREGWYEFADLFLWQYNRNVPRSVERVVFLSRMPVIFLTIGLALAGFHFAKELWGRSAAIPALYLFLFEPNLIAHGRLATTDLGGTLFTFLATFALWRLWQRAGRWDVRRWLTAAFLMGLAFGSKLSAVGFVLIWAFQAILPIFPEDSNGWKSGAVMRLGQFITAGLLSLVVVWGIFGFQWGAFQFISPALYPFNLWKGPMPTFWAGLEQIVMLGSEGRATAFLFGRFSETGFLAYFPAAFVVKTPVILLAIVGVAAIWLVARKETRMRALFLLVAGCGFFGLTMLSALNIGYRHALPALPYFLLVASGLAVPIQSSTVQSTISVYRRRLLITGIAILLGVAMWVYPHYLSYFNAASGGPSNGYRLLTDSNIDWGQDLLRLKEWMADHQVSSVRLGWFGTADPEYYRITYSPLPGLGRDEFFRLWWEPPFNTKNPEPGVYAISASSLWEPPLRVEEKVIYSWFRQREPDDRIGYSILVYDLR